MLGVLVGKAGGDDPSAAPPGADLLEAELSQSGRSLTFTLRTSTAVPLAELDRLPPTRAKRSRFLCLALRPIGRRGERRLCLGGPHSQRRIGLLLVKASGKTTHRQTLSARVRRPAERRLVVAMVPGNAGLKPHRYRWQVLENRRGCERSEDRLPERRFRVFRLRPVRAVGCTGGRAGVVYNGPAANAMIRQATHFQPCVFRPPGGALSSSVVDLAGQLGMRTILWDVDPSDWSNPGSGAIYSRVVGAARPGSIVVMHDGGGNRSGTLAALPSIIDTLKARGFRLVTVSELLGNRIIYRPYG